MLIAYAKVLVRAGWWLAALISVLWSWWYHGVCVGLTKVDLEHNPDLRVQPVALPLRANVPPCVNNQIGWRRQGNGVTVAAGRARSPALVYRNAIAKGESSSVQEDVVVPGAGNRQPKSVLHIEGRARGVSLDLRRTNALMQQWERDEQQQAAVPFGGRSIPIDPMQLDLGLPPENNPQLCKLYVLRRSMLRSKLVLPWQ